MGIRQALPPNLEEDTGPPSANSPRALAGSRPPMRIPSPPRDVAVALCLMLSGIAGLIAWRAYTHRTGTDRAIKALRDGFITERPVEARLSGFTYAPLLRT